MFRAVAFQEEHVITKVYVCTAPLSNTVDQWFKSLLTPSASS